ncbi:hypothetical protein NQZ79_g6105 [Umbelopsis isabellina]|nr:hypothetical protein NQZ79_g6105 [Umbelopsis isabellina]
MQRAITLLPRLKPTIVPCYRSAALIQSRWASSIPMSTAQSVPTSTIINSIRVPVSQPNQSVTSITLYMAALKPFHPPTVPSTPSKPTMHATSVLRKRKLKMNKHKHKKLMKRTRALRKRIGK